MVTLPHGETNITLACQNKCVSCNHFVGVLPPWMCDPKVLERDLAMAAKVMHFQVYNFVGGEPTLHPKLLDLLDILAASGITNRIEITSNGQGYKRLPDAFYQKIDDLIITPYKLNDEEKAYITNKCADFGVSLQWHPVIFTYAGYKAPDAERGTRLYQTCWYKVNRNVIDEGYFYRCCIGRFIPELLQGKQRTAEALPLEGLTTERLVEFLNAPETPEMCNVCGSNCAPRLNWHEQKDPGLWLEESLL